MVFYSADVTDAHVFKIILISTGHLLVFPMKTSRVQRSPPPTIDVLKIKKKKKLVQSYVDVAGFVIR